MRIEYNGNRVESLAANVAEFLAEQNIDASCVAVAADGHFVPRRDYKSRLLTEGAKLEILVPMQGG